MSSLADRVVSRFIQSSGDGNKFIGRDCRLTWTHHVFKLEELPQKGKRRLREATLQNFQYMHSSSVNTSPLIPENLIHRGHISPSDDYDTVKAKLFTAFQAAVEDIIAASPVTEKLNFMREVQWYEDERHYLQVTPEDVAPLVVQGKDFKVTAKWTSFEAYSPDSDFHQADPYYSKIVSTAAAPARKLYQILKAKPDALSTVAFSRFDEWLKGQKINYKYEHSVWH